MRQLLPVVGNGTPLQLIPREALAEAKHVAPVGAWLRASTCVAELALEIWASEPCTADVTLLAATPHPLRLDGPLELVVEDDRLVSKAYHRLQTGDGPFYTTTGSAAHDVQPCWVKKLDGKSLRLCNSLDALLGEAEGEVPAAVRAKGTTALVAYGAIPAGSPAAVATPMGPQRLCWAFADEHLGAKLGPQEGIARLLRHTPRTLAYALVGTGAPHGASKDKGPPLIVHGAIWPLREV